MVSAGMAIDHMQMPARPPAVKMETGEAAVPSGASLFLSNSYEQKYLFAS